MSPEKDEELCKKYPNLYAQRNWKMTRTCMCWGFECGEGWYDLINDLSAKLENLSVQATQVKEKFGGLRFYYECDSRHADEVDAAVRKAEKKSYRTCEICGKAGKARDWGWIQTLCEGHWDEKQAELKARGHLKEGLSHADV